MPRRVFGQLDNREERAREYQSWCSATRVRPGGVEEPPPSIDPVEVVREIRVMMAAGHESIDCRMPDSAAVAEVARLLTGEERKHVQFYEDGAHAVA